MEQRSILSDKVKYIQHNQHPICYYRLDTEKLSLDFIVAYKRRKERL